MMKKLLIAILACLMTMSCSKYEYTDELQKLGGRVEYLEETLSDIEKRIETLRKIITVIENNGYITDMMISSDGEYYLTFNNGETIVLRQGKKGKDGEEIDFMIDVKKGEDGIYYWTINGKWLLNEDGNRVPASAQDGKDGNDGKPMSETGAIAPQMRINPLNRHWEISTDGGNTWSDTGFVADGTNGTDGKDGANDIFSSVTLSDDKKSITFVLRNGDSYTVQII